VELRNSTGRVPPTGTRRVEMTHTRSLLCSAAGFFFGKKPAADFPEEDTFNCCTTKFATWRRASFENIAMSMIAVFLQLRAVFQCVI
jgi:hypothetical protein